MEVFNPSRYSIGLNSNIQLNNFGKNVYFGQNPIQDSFQSNSPLQLFNENEIKKLISQNPDVKKILSENKKRP